MSGITVPMAIIDFVPVVMFFIAAVILQRDLYSKLVKGAFALLASGSISWSKEPSRFLHQARFWSC